MKYQKKLKKKSIPDDIPLLCSKIAIASKGTTVFSLPFHDWKYIHRDQNLLLRQPSWISLYTFSHYKLDIKTD